MTNMGNGLGYHIVEPLNFDPMLSGLEMYLHIIVTMIGRHLIKFPFEIPLLSIFLKVICKIQY